MSLLQERLRDPVHLGAVEAATHVGAVGNPACGDVVTLHLRVRDGRIEAAGFESIGSAYQLATASVLCDCVLGQTVEEALARSPSCVLKRLPDLPERYRYLARLGIEALHRALIEPDGDAPAAEETLREAGSEEAAALVLGLLADGRAWSTREVEAMARADGLRLPGSALRFLSTMRREGRVEGRMSVRHRTWLWSVTPERDAGSSAAGGPQGATRR